MTYPKLGAGEGNRTPVLSLGSFHSTIELHPHQMLCILAICAAYVKEILDLGANHKKRIDQLTIRF